jgi:hypothetical protein
MKVSASYFVLKSDEVLLHQELYCYSSHNISHNGSNDDEIDGSSSERDLMEFKLKK